MSSVSTGYAAAPVLVLAPYDTAMLWADDQGVDPRRVVWQGDFARAMNAEAVWVAAVPGYTSELSADDRAVLAMLDARDVVRYGHPGAGLIEWLNLSASWASLWWELMYPFRRALAWTRGLR